LNRLAIALAISTPWLPNCLETVITDILIPPFCLLFEGAFRGGNLLTPKLPPFKTVLSPLVRKEPIAITELQASMKSGRETALSGS
jgi:hypothetical protein